MKLELKYGCNPHQRFARASTDGPSPIELLNGRPSYINLLDALNAWQLVKEARGALGLPAAASFKHVSPAGAAVAVELSDDLARAYEVERSELTPTATAYVRARGADPKSSFGDFVALSDPVDEATARFLKTLVCDGIIAPGFEPGALDILKAKKKGSFIVIQADEEFEPPKTESRQICGVTLEQDRNDALVSSVQLERMACGTLEDSAKRDLILGLIVLKYTQSNSVGYALDGQMIGIGAGQQSRVDCTKLAGSKADVWHLQRHPRVLGLKFRAGVGKQERINWRVRFIEGELLASEEARFREALDEAAAPLSAEDKAAWISDALKGVSLVSDGFLPFRDNIDHAARHGVEFVAQPGGSVRDDEIVAACTEHGIAMAMTGLRLFHH